MEYNGKKYYLKPAISHLAIIYYYKKEAQKGSFFCGVEYESWTHDLQSHNLAL